MELFNSNKNDHTLIAGKYKILSMLGKGGFGETHLAVNIITGEEVAIKMETKVSGKESVLFEEYKVYNALNSEPRNPVVPTIYHYGDTIFSNILVMDVFGKTLEQLFESCGKSFSLKTFLLIAD